MRAIGLLKPGLHPPDPRLACHGRTLAAGGVGRLLTIVLGGG